MREAYPNELYHHGILGQRWGVRRYQNKDGTLTDLGKKRYGYTSEDTVFISGKVKYDQPIDDNIKAQVDAIMKAGANIVIGDAPGADKRVQDYLAEKGYTKVKVYTTDDDARNNVGNWKTELSSRHAKAMKEMRNIEKEAYEKAIKETGWNPKDYGRYWEESVDNLRKKVGKEKAEKIASTFSEINTNHRFDEWDQRQSEYWDDVVKENKNIAKARRQKDIAMTNVATKGLAISPSDDRRGSATSRNVKRLRKHEVPVMVYNYDKQRYEYR